MSRKGKVESGSDLSALQGDHVWLNPTPADKTRVAIGGIIKETKPGKILVEDDEGKVSMATLLRGSAFSAAVQNSEPPPFSGAAPNTRDYRAQVWEPRGRIDHRGVLSWQAL